MYDYILIGAGAAGCALAARLTADPRVEVLLMEAGPPDRDRRIRVPSAFPSLLKSALDWSDTSQPQEHLNRRRLDLSRGKVLGGDSSIGATMYRRGPLEEDLRPYAEAAATALRVSPLAAPHPLSTAFLEACAGQGIRRVDNISEPGAAGCGFSLVMQKRGRRWSAADAYLRPALRRGNLTVWTGIQAGRVLIEAGRAVGVVYVQKGSLYEVRAAREVILCAGAAGSPPLLLRSGIGPPSQLEPLGIPVAAALEGVGRNLQVVLGVPISYSCAQPASLRFQGNVIGAPKLLDRLRYLVSGSGPLASCIFEAAVVVNSNLEILFVPAPFPDFGATPHAFTLVPILIAPKSRGSVCLVSADPLAAPAIDPGFLSDPTDLVPLDAGVRLARRIADAKPLDKFRGPPAVSSTLDSVAHIRGFACALGYAGGTCKMGEDPDGVVDSNLQVHGVPGLRVADASVIPTAPAGGTTHAIAIAEKAARLILG